MFLFFHRWNVTYVLEINVVMITTSLHSRSLHKPEGGGFRRSKNKTQKIRWHLDVQEKYTGVNEVDVVNEENTINKVDEMTEVRKSSKSMSFQQRMRRSQPHNFPSNDRLKDKSVP